MNALLIPRACLIEDEQHAYSGLLEVLYNDCTHNCLPNARNPNTCKPARPNALPSLLLSAVQKSLTSAWVALPNRVIVLDLVVIRFREDELGHFLPSNGLLRRHDGGGTDIIGAIVLHRVVIAAKRMSASCIDLSGS